MKWEMALFEATSKFYFSLKGHPSLNRPAVESYETHDAAGSSVLFVLLSSVYGKIVLITVFTAEALR